MSASIIKCLNDEELFKPHFKGTSWAAWWCFLKALFAESMTTGELEIYRRHTGRTEEPWEPFTEAALVVGRRGGKSRVLALVATFLATCRDYREYLAPGEVATVAILSADRRQARTIYRYILGLLQKVRMFKPLLLDANAEQITLSCPFERGTPEANDARVVIEITTASFRTARGYSFAAVLCDEIAFWQSDETAANPDVEILRALRPGMASIPGSILLLASSPYAKKGELYGAFRKHFGKDGARVLVWKGTTAEMNPRIDKRIIAEAYEDDPESARAEYGAEFRDDLSDYITREIVEAVTMFGRTSLPPQPGIIYSAFCDPSGGLSDAMTLAVGHLDDRDICIQDYILDIRPPFNPDNAVKECAEVLGRYRITKVMGDRYAGLWPQARFAEAGITFEQSARPKSDLYLDLLPLFNSRRIELLDYGRMMREFCGLERKTARSGRDSVDHHAGGHDDVCNAAAGLLVGLDLDRRQPMIGSAVTHPVEVKPVPMPEVAAWVASLTVVDKAGIAATIYMGQGFGEEPPLLILDFDRGPMGGSLFGDVVNRLEELAKATRSHAVYAFAQAELVMHAEAAGLSAAPLPTDVRIEDLRLAAALHASRLSICTLAREKAATSPLMAALDIRAAGELVDALPMAMVWSISLAMGVEPLHEAA